ncbi:DivIVA domain-containing protein [Nocardioides marmoraquaticus]
MSWFFAVLLVLVVGAVAVVFAGGGGSAAPAYDDRPDSGLPDDRPLTAGDLRGVRLSTAVRGYRADEVDDLLERLARQLEGRDAPVEESVRPGDKVVLEPGERPRYPEVTDR